MEPVALTPAPTDPLHEDDGGWYDAEGEETYTRKSHYRNVELATPNTCRFAKDANTGAAPGVRRLRSSTPAALRSRHKVDTGAGAVDTRSVNWLLWTAKTARREPGKRPRAKSFRVVKSRVTLQVLARRGRERRCAGWGLGQALI